LLSLILSGTVLAASGLYFLSVLKTVSIDRIDREILALGGSQLHTQPAREYWRLHFGESLRLLYGKERSKQLIIQVRGPWNEILYETENWPQEISGNLFPGFDRKMDTRPVVGRLASGVQRPPGAPAGPPPVPPPRPSPFAEQPRGLFNEDPRRPRFDGLYGRPGPPLPRPYARDERGQEFRPPHADLVRPNGPARLIKKPFFQTVTTPSGSFRVGIMGNPRVTILLGMNLAGYYRDAERFQKALLSAVPIALLLLAGGGWVIAHRAMKPIAQITRTAEGITARALDRRIPPIDADRELSRLVKVINGMLDRLQKSFGQAIRFSADAAHELQTPLTILQGELDDAVQHSPINSDEQRRYGALLEEVQRLKAIVQKLLILARADAGKLDLRLEPVDLGALLESAAEDVGAIAPHLRVEKQLAPGGMVLADPDLLRQVIQNLSSNAVKYNIENGQVAFRMQVNGDTVRVVISNTGKAISPEDRERIFDRFFRADKARSRVVPGSGLGLSLAREIVHAHRGVLRLDPAGPGNVVSFSLSMPVCPPHQVPS